MAKCFLLRFFCFSFRCFTQSASASAFPCASKQHVIIMPFGKCTNGNETLKWGAIQLYISMYGCVSVVRALTITHGTRTQNISLFSHKIEY